MTGRRRVLGAGMAAAVVLVWGGSAGAQEESASAKTTGSRTRTSVSPKPANILPNQWKVQPAGETRPLGEYPLSLTLSPDGRWGAVVHCGVGAHEVRVIDLQTRQEVSSAPLRNGWSAAAWSPDGTRLYVSRGADDALARFDVRQGILSGETTISLTVPDDPPSPSPRFPSALALTPDGRTAYVTELYTGRLLRVQIRDAGYGVQGAGTAESREQTSACGSQSQSPTAPSPSPASQFRLPVPAPAVQVVCRFEGAASRPWGVVLHPARPVAYVSLLGADAVAEVDLVTGAVERIGTDAHPGAMVLSRDGRRLFVACSNSNFVDEIDTKWREVEQSIPTSLFPDTPPGSTPSALALSPDEVFLAVANSDNNNLAVFDIRRPGEADPLGYVPTGWYPTAVAYAPDLSLVAVNGRGDGAPPASPPGKGPLPGGTIQFVNKLDRSSLWEHTQAVYPASPLRGDLAPVGAQDAEATGPVPRSVGERSPIFYVVCIVRGRATYDQVLGDMPGGNGNAALCEFGESVTPNAHALAREFVLLDNFYAEAVSAADGAGRSTAAASPACVERLWPSVLGGHGALPWPSGGHDPAGRPAAGYLWDRAFEAGVSYRSYGVHAKGGGTACDAVPLGRSLESALAPCYPAPGTGRSDRERAAEFLKELSRYNTESVLPRLTVIRLPGEVGKGMTPAAAMADQDRALGEILEGLGASRFWKAMAVFVVEESAAGPDSVSPQRSVALLAGPWVKRGEVVSTRYSTSGVLRTVELILGLAPMSQSDAAARPLYDCFTAEPDLRPFRMQKSD